MTIYLATKTLNAIDETIQSDQGAKFRQYLQKVLPHIGDAYRGEAELFRSHMGASGIAKECGRAIWYGFRWFTPSNFTGRMQRLFNRGHMEEGRFIAMLLTIGCQVYQQDANGKQFRISGSHGHFGGSGDGVVIGLPDLPAGTAALAEFKTHSSSSFKKLEKEGMRGAKPEHYIQMQSYMDKMQLAYGFYLAVNKDNDQLYGEIILLDSPTAQTYADRADRIIWMRKPPARISNSPGAFKCTFCDHKAVCHLKATPHRNCRTCTHSKPAENNQWLCEQHNAVLTKEMQLAGCQTWAPIEDAGYAAPSA